MPLVSSGACDIGKVRESNQDCIYINPQKKIFMVADGMGGHEGGEIASRMAIDIISDFYTNNENLDPKELCLKSIEYANKKIQEKSTQEEKLKSMGTTITSLYFHENKAYVANVGDSRSYLINRNQLYQLTEDHSLVQEKLKQSIYTREEASLDPQTNILVRALGTEDVLETDLFYYRVNPNDIFLLCSDGLHSKVSDADILYIINQHIPDPSKVTISTLQEVIKKLVHQANLNGGNDNISVILTLIK